MKNLLLPIIPFLLLSCNIGQEMSSIDPVNWEKRTISHSLPDSMLTGTTYLSIYSHIYNRNEHRIQDLTVTVSMRNINMEDTIFVDRADYYNTKGEAIRTYFDETIFIAPLETVEIVIDELDIEGGSGANFLFHWKTYPASNEPLFEAAMVSSSGQYGLSLTTRGVRVD